MKEIKKVINAIDPNGTSEGRISTIINRILITIIIVLPCFYTFLGIDITDTGYWMTRYKYAFNSLGMIEPAVGLTILVGGFLYSLLQQYNYLSFSVLWYLSYMAVAYFTYDILKKHVNKTILLIGLVISVFLIKRSPAFWNYNSSTVLVQYTGLWVLFKYFGNRQLRYIFLSAVIFGVNVFTRLPNVLQFGYIIVLWFVLFIESRKVKILLYPTIVYICGYVLGLLSGGFTIFAFVGFSGLQRSFQRIYKIGTNSDVSNGHAIKSMVSNLISAFRNGLNVVSIIVIFIILVIIGIYIFKHVFNKINSSFRDRIILISAAIITVDLAFYYSRGVDLINIGTYFSILFSGAILLSSVYLLFQLYSKNDIQNENILFSALILVAIYTMIITSLGSDTGIALNHTNFFLPLSIMFGLLYKLFDFHRGEIIITVKSRAQAASLSFKYSYLIVVFFVAFSLFYAIRLPLYYTYRDGEFWKLTAFARQSDYYGVLTTPKRAEAFDELSNALNSFTNGQNELIAYGQIPAAHILTGIKPYLTNPWPDLESYSINTMTNTINTKTVHGNYPIIVISKRKASEKWPDGPEIDFSRDEKYNLLIKYINRYNYTIIYDSRNFIIYIPNKLE